MRRNRIRSQGRWRGLRPIRVMKATLRASFNTTMGASVDLESEGLRRLLVNGCYWCMGMEGRYS